MTSLLQPMSPSKSYSKAGSLVPPSPARSLARNRSKGSEDIPTPRKLTDWEENYAKEIFQAYDYDDSGSINRTELQELLMEQQWCMDQRALDDFIRKHVGPEISEVDYTLFLRIYAAMLARQPSSVRRKRENGRIKVEDMYELEDSARKVFQMMDEDGTGYLNEDEMREVMREAGLPDTDGDNYESVVVEHMRLYDADQDGQISFEEFVLYRNAVLEHFYKQAQAQNEARVTVDPEREPWHESLFAS